ncbi:MAG: ferrous iron transport protein A [Hyphomicrobiales bacterium]|nr:MAG: ferrous iron transport protein A [Hyphomicrobiales bacterium]
MIEKLRHIDEQKHAFPLALAAEGEEVCIYAMKGGKGLSRKLMDLGLSLGSSLKVMQRRPGGALVVARGNLRVALGAGMAQKVVVALTTASSASKA